MTDRQRMIITFKPKDRRQDTTTDKVDIVQAITDDDNAPTFLTAEMVSMGRAAPSRVDFDSLGYDVNRYDAPIVVTMLSEDEADRLRADPNVRDVEHDGEMFAMGPTTGLVLENVPEVASETVPTGVSAIGAPDAWSFSQGKAIKVFVLDTGIDGSHPDLAANLRAGRSFVPDESTTDDFNGHGTHCAGTIAAALNGSGVVGVAPAAYLHPVKVLNRTGSGAWSGLIAALDWVMDKKGQRIASMSLGGASAPTALEQMCDAAAADGVLLVAAAGNSGPPPGRARSSVGAPAQYDSVIAVSAIDSNNAIASFSSRGPEVELCAPGVQVLSTWPGGGYRRLNGTSMACPHVAGTAAVAWGSHRWGTNDELRRLLALTADALGVPGRDDLFGFGRVDAHQASAWSLKPGPGSVPGLP